MSIYDRIDENKAALDRLRPFEGDMLEQIRQYYKIGLTWSSNAIEGNTLTISETKVVLEDGLTIGGKPLRDFMETVGHGEAYDYMFSLIGEKRISIDTVKKIHRLFYRGIDEANAGAWRRQEVIVSGTEFVFPAPGEIEGEMKRLEAWIGEERNKYHPVDFAAMLHLKLVTTHPFIDGNGRAARLLMNLALLQDGHQLAIIPPVCRSEYLDAIRHYQRKNEARPFCDFIAGRVLESQKEIMRLLHIGKE